MRRWGLWAVVAVLAAAVAAPAFSALTPPSGEEALVMVSLSPCAVFDTRDAIAGRLGSGEIRGFSVVGDGDFSWQGGPAKGCNVPGYLDDLPQAQAVLLNLVAIDPQGGGNLKTWAGGAPEATGGVVNYQALAPPMNNSNAIVVELNQTSAGKDIAVKANGSAVHVRGVVLGYFVSGDQTFLSYDGYDPDRDGSVAAADSADWAADAGAVDGFEGADLLETYCAHRRLHPESYPAGPCQSYTTTLDSAGNVGSNTSIAIGVDGNPIISYQDSTNWALKVVHCTDPACSGFDTRRTLETVGWPGGRTSIAIGVDGNPIISYRHGTDTDLKAVHCTDPACATSDPPVALDSVGEVGYHSSLAIGVDGRPIISYYDQSNSALKVVHCTDVACTAADTPVTLDSAGIVGQYTSLAIGEDGNPIISYYDGTNGDLKVVHCTQAVCSTADTPTTLDSAGDVGWFTSLTIGVDGNPVISYFDFTNWDTKLVHCTDVACADADAPRSLDTTGDTNSTSIAVGIDGTPIVAYRDDNTGELRLVRCTDAACTAADSPRTVDTGNVGGSASLAIGADGLPAVSYRAATPNQDLKVARVGG